MHPDAHPGGALVASRLRMQFDVWKYPTDGAPDDNVRRALRVTNQSGQVQTPTVGVSDREIAFLADSGGHANVWVTGPAVDDLRQITFERDPNVALGVPIWSPDGKWIAFVSSRGNTGLAFGVWLVSPDGGNLRNLATRGLGITWAPDAQWVYYADAGVLYKVPTAGGSPVRVREGPARNVIGLDGKTLYFLVDRTLTDASPAFDECAQHVAAGLVERDACRGLAIGDAYDPGLELHNRRSAPLQPADAQRLIDRQFSGLVGRALMPATRAPRSERHLI